MASVKNLKKDVNYLTDEVVGTCLMHQMANKNQNREKVETLIDQMLEIREQTIHNLNHPANTPDQSLKSYYNQILEEFMSKVNDIFDSLGNMEE